jgi:glycosyltransferase involved in cell wall biosynthesis
MACDNGEKRPTVAVVIPCYNVAGQLQKVLDTIPPSIDYVIPVDDCSPDGTKELIAKAAQSNLRIQPVYHTENRGVGGAMVSGFRAAIRLGADIILKLDGDGQMDPVYMEPMVQRLCTGQCDFVKGNRFHNRLQIKNMPVVRRIGNMGMGFLVKMASGYWNISDPTNGYFAIRRETLEKLPFERLSPRFFFESSLIIELYYTGARIQDMGMPAIYGTEKSNLSIWQTLFTFPGKLARAFFRRIRLRYFVCDFNINSLYILFGWPLFLFGVIFGICKWIHFAGLHTPAPTGTIMIAVLGVVLGFQMLLASVQYDITAANPFEGKA